MFRVEKKLMLRLGPFLKSVTIILLKCNMHPFGVFGDLLYIHSSVYTMVILLEIFHMVDIYMYVSSGYLLPLCSSVTDGLAQTPTPTTMTVKDRPAVTGPTSFF